MSEAEALELLAGAAGIEPGYWDIAGTWHPTGDATRRALLRAMGLPDHGATTLRETAARLLAATPAAPEPLVCVTPQRRGIERAWGVTCQVYGLRSARNAGMGDLEDVARLAETLAAQGADFLGLSPLHALFPDIPERASPYAPSSRTRLNENLIAVDVAAADLGLAIPMPAIDAEPDLIDHPAVAAAKAEALRELWRAFCGEGDATAGALAFAAWRAKQSVALQRFCVFQAIALHQARRAGRPLPPEAWPAGLRSPDGPDVASFASAHADEVAFRAFLQWVATRQLEAAQRRAKAAGMRIGLYLDLAVGVVPDGAEAWVERARLVEGASIGAPPDPFSATGQNWNVATPSPVTLATFAGEPLRGVWREAMRHAGAVRIDHALKLMRLFLIPAGGTAADGAYVRYPLEVLLRALAEESQASGCIVIGEDLGTVPEGFRERMERAGLLGYRVTWFERDPGTGSFQAPEHYTEAALASVSTHDLPTVAGFGIGRDLGWREQLGQLGDRAAARAAHHARESDQRHLHDALHAAGTLDPADGADALTLGLHRMLARSRSCLAAIQLEDLIGEVEQPNLPGTIDEHPNWRRRYGVPIEQVTSLPRAAAILRLMRRERPRPG